MKGFGARAKRAAGLCALAVGSVAVSFALAESVLGLFGYSGPGSLGDPQVGFSGQPLFVSEHRADGSHHLVTAPGKDRFFNRQSFPAKKGHETRRIFCLGGSTTYGRPYDDEVSFCGWLRVFLPVAAPEFDWEVINAGGISYASYRVAGVMQELADYSPDLFIVYSGHNEFLEERTYRKLMNLPRPLRRLDSSLRQTRSYTALHDLVQQVREVAGGKDGRHELSNEVDALLDRSVGPQDYHRDDALQQQVTAHFALNLERMIRMGREAGGEVVLVTPASNLGGSSPFKSEVSKSIRPEERERFAALLEGGLDLLEAGRPGAARLLLTQALEIDPRHAHAWFFLGKAERAQGRQEAAATAFVRARDEDICPLRALSGFASIIREISQRVDAPLVDFEAKSNSVARERYGHAVPGTEQFLDHVHPTIEGNRELALEIIDELAARDWVRLSSTWNERRIAMVSERVMEELDQARHAVAFRNLAKVLSWAGKDAEAEQSARRALALDPSDSESHFIIGLLSAAAGRNEQAIVSYREALRVSPEYQKARHNLAISLTRSGQHEAAIAHYEKVLDLNPDHPNVRFNMANALVRTGRIEAALRRYLEVITRDPEDLDAHFNLARVYERNGDLTAALRHYEEAARLNPNDQETISQVASLRQELRTDAGPAALASGKHVTTDEDGSEPEANDDPHAGTFPGL